jgi:thiol-disulfide isomerase/thioredoxin
MKKEKPIALKKYLNYLFYILIIGFVLYTKAPLIYQNFQSEGIKLNTRPIKVIGEEIKEMDFPSPDKKYLVIFWSTICAPCKVEMIRLEKSVKAGKIKKGQIIAINPFESQKKIEKFLFKNNYSFVFASDTQLAYELKVEVTPTTVLLDGLRVESVHSGMSTYEIFRAESFLSP